MLQKLSHTNIGKYYDWCEDDEKFYVIMEMLKLPNLRTFLKQRKDINQILSEAEVKKIVYDILSAIKYWNQNGVSHLDIRPEKVLIDENSCWKLIDFRLRKSLTIVPQLTKSSDCPYFYWAPEFLEGALSPKSDIWSIGILIFYMLTGRTPIGDIITEKDLLEEIKNVNINDHEMDGISDECKNLLENMLIVDPMLRFSASQWLKHEWFKNLNP